VVPSPVAAPAPPVVVTATCWYSIRDIMVYSWGQIYSAPDE
jgi:hypothetical protein